MIKKKLSIRWTILSTFLIVAGVATIVSIAVQFYFSRDLAQEGAIRQFQQLADKVSERASSLQNSGTTITELLANTQEIYTPIDIYSTHPITAIMASTLQLNPSLYTLFLANADNSYLQLVNLSLSESTRASWKASPQDRWLELRFISNGEQSFMVKRFLDDNLNVRVTAIEPSEYQATQRPWFKMAKANVVTKSAPYIYRFTGDTGVSFAIQAAPGKVVGTGIILSEMMREIQEGLVIKDMTSFLFNEKGHITAKSKDGTPTARYLDKNINLTDQELAFLQQHSTITVSNESDYPPFDFSVGGKPSGYFPELFEHITAQLGLNVVYTNGTSFGSLLDSFRNNEIDVLLSVRINDQRKTMGYFTDPVFDSQMVAITRKTNKNNYRNLGQMSELTFAVPRAYATTEYLQRHFPELSYIEVDNSIEAMRLVAKGEADALIEMDTVAKYIEKYFFIDGMKFSEPLRDFEGNNEFDLYFLVRKSYQPLVGAINKALKNISEDTRAKLYKKWLSVDPSEPADDMFFDLTTGKIPFNSLIDIAETSSNHDPKKIKTQDKDYYAFAIPLDTNLLEGNEIQEYFGVLISVDEAVKPYFTKVYIAMIFSTAAFFILLPLIFYMVRLIERPLLQMLHNGIAIAQGKSELLNPLDSQIKEISLLSESLEQAVLHLRNKHHSVINLMTQAGEFASGFARKQDPQQHLGFDSALPFAQKLINECEKSPILKKSGRQLSQSDKRNITLCLSLTQFVRFAVPTELANKQTKLTEQQIDNIRMRIEVQWHESESLFWQEVSRNPDNEKILRHRLKQKVTQLKESYLSVLKSNSGRTTLTEENAEQLGKLAHQQWVRKLNPNVKLSEVESMRVDAQHLYSPCIEKLLDDAELTRLSIPFGCYSEPDVAEINRVYTTALNALLNNEFVRKDLQVQHLMETIFDTFTQGVKPVKALQDGIIVFSVGLLRAFLHNTAREYPLSHQHLLMMFKEQCSQCDVLAQLYSLFIDQDMLQDPIFAAYLDK